jgi:hypothetical protein
MQEEIKYGQLWARHSELVVADQVGNYRISFEGMKRAIEEVLRMQHPGSNVWVKMSDRLPDKDGYYHVRKKPKKPTETDKDLQYYHSETKRFSWDNVIEWLDESNEQPVEQKENEVAILRWLREEGWEPRNHTGWAKHADNESYYLTDKEIWNEYQKQKNGQ